MAHVALRGLADGVYAGQIVPEAAAWPHINRMEAVGALALVEDGRESEFVDLIARREIKQAMALAPSASRRSIHQAMLVIRVIGAAALNQPSVRTAPVIHERADLYQLDKDELVEVAGKVGVEVDESTHKATIIRLIMEAQA